MSALTPAWQTSRGFSTDTLSKAGAHIYAMPMPVFLILAASIGAGASANAPLVIDLLIAQPCAQADDAAIDGEIVVCGERERQSSHRLGKMDRQTGNALPKAEIQLADGASVGVETESADLGMVRAQRAMVRVKFKF